MFNKLKVTQEGHHKRSVELVVKRVLSERRQKGNISYDFSMNRKSVIGTVDELVYCLLLFTSLAAMEAVHLYSAA